MLIGAAPSYEGNVPDNEYVSGSSNLWEGVNYYGISPLILYNEYAEGDEEPVWVAYIYPHYSHYGDYYPVDENGRTIYDGWSEPAFQTETRLLLVDPATGKVYQKSVAVKSPPQTNEYTTCGDYCPQTAILELSKLLPKDTATLAGCEYDDVFTTISDYIWGERVSCYASDGTPSSVSGKVFVTCNCSWAECQPYETEYLGYGYYLGLPTDMLASNDNRDEADYYAIIRDLQRQTKTYPDGEPAYRLETHLYIVERETGKAWDKLVAYSDPPEYNPYGDYAWQYSSPEKAFDTLRSLMKSEHGPYYGCSLYDVADVLSKFSYSAEKNEYYRTEENIYYSDIRTSSLPYSITGPVCIYLADGYTEGNFFCSEKDDETLYRTSLGTIRSCSEEEAQWFAFIFSRAFESKKYDEYESGYTVETYLMLVEKETGKGYMKCVLSSPPPYNPEEGTIGEQNYTKALEELYRLIPDKLGPYYKMDGEELSYLSAYYYANPEYVSDESSVEDVMYGKNFGTFVPVYGMPSRISDSVEIILEDDAFDSENGIFFDNWPEETDEGENVDVLKYADGCIRITHDKPEWIALVFTKKTAARTYPDGETGYNTETAIILCETATGRAWLRSAATTYAPSTDEEGCEGPAEYAKALKIIQSMIPA